MAIQKTKTLPSGITGNYWRFLNITFNRETLIATAQIGLFKDKATSDAGGSHLGLIKNYTFPFTPYDLNSTIDIVAFIYGKIVSKADTLVYKDITGQPLPVPLPFDSDIAGGVSV